MSHATSHIMLAVLSHCNPWNIPRVPCHGSYYAVCPVPLSLRTQGTIPGISHVSHATSHIMLSVLSHCPLRMQGTIPTCPMQWVILCCQSCPIVPLGHKGQSLEYHTCPMPRVILCCLSCPIVPSGHKGQSLEYPMCPMPWVIVCCLSCPIVPPGHKGQSLEYHK